MGMAEGLTLPGNSLHREVESELARYRARYRFSVLTSEFADPAVETAFREFIYPVWVKNTRHAMVMAALFYLAFAVCDVLLLESEEALRTVILTRILISAAGLGVAYSAEYFWRALVDGVTPTLVVGLAMTGFLSFTFLFPFDAAWHVMGMMIMLLGIYVFIPNRFLLATSVSVLSTFVFIYMLLSHFELSPGQTMLLWLTLVGMNLFGAVSAARISQMSRESYRDAQVLRLANQRLAEEMGVRLKLEQDLRALAEHDELTGLMNRRRFEEVTLDWMERLAERPYRLSLLLLRVDYFKQLRDTYGHLRADEALKALARFCERFTGGEAVLARAGEVSFALLLPQCEQDAARELAERMRQGAEQSSLSLADITVHLTLSVAVAQWGADENVALFLRRADQGLQAVQARGGNRVEIVPYA